MFTLLRYFSLASLVSIVIATLVLGWFYRSATQTNLSTAGSANHATVAQIMANALRPEIRAQLEMARPLADEAVRRHAQTERLQRILVEWTRQSDILKIKLYSLDGRTVYSSEPKQIGENKRGNAGFQSALAGASATELTQRDHFSAFEQVIENRGVLSSYVPLRDPVTGQVEAVFEVYSDVTGVVGALAAGELKAVAGVVLVLFALYCVLFFIVRRADRILQSQHGQHLSHEAALASARDALEARVTERTRDLDLAREEAEAASRTKSQFLTSMSHEIRTPLNGVLGMAELLENTPLDPGQVRYVQAISASGRALHGLLSDILDLAKIEAGKVELEQMDFDLAHVVDDLLAAYRELAMSKGCELLASAPPAALRVTGDRMRLRQILANLLGNAVKFTEQGRIDLECRQIEPAAGDAGKVGEARIWLRFVVRDNGIGMTPDAQAALFQPFVQADASTTRKFGGTGLGLVICKYLVELMGGKISVESRPGRGTTFYVDLPFALAHSLSYDVSHPHIVPIKRGVAHVLVVEDNRVNQEVIGKLLEWFGAQVTVVENGALAVEAVQQNGPGGSRSAQQAPFDLVFMDCQMPVMDGLEATRRIRAWEREHPAYPARGTLPIVALTANALAGDREACLAAGMTDYLAKPILKAQLTGMLAKYLSWEAPFQRDGVALAPPPKSPAPPATLTAEQADVAAVPPAAATVSAAPAVVAAIPAAGLAAFDPAPLNSLPMVADGSAPELATRLLAVFTDDTRAMLLKLDAAAEAGDTAVMRRHVHSLKSSSAQVGAFSLSAEARRQEQAIDAGAAPEADWQSRLSVEFAAFETALNQHQWTSRSARNDNAGRP